MLNEALRSETSCILPEEIQDSSLRKPSFGMTARFDLGKQPDSHSIFRLSFALQLV